MKTTTTVITLLLCLFFSAACFAQRENTWKDVTYLSDHDFHDYPDSVRIEFPAQKAIVVFQMKRVLRDPNFTEGFQEHLQSWLKSISAGASDLNVPQQVHVKHVVNEVFDPNSSSWKDAEQDVFSMKANTEKPTRIVADKTGVVELVPAGWEIFFESSKKKIYIYAPTFKDLESLAQQNFQVANEKIQEHLKEHPLLRKSLVSRVVEQDNKITYSAMKRRSAQDFLELNGGAGFGFLKDHFFPELHLSVAFRFGDHFARPNYGVSFIYSNMFFAQKRSDGGYQSNVNSFVSASFNLNLQKGGKPPVWTGVGAGFLIHREGDYFQGKTMKFFTTTKVGHVTVSPEIYLTNGVKDFSMGLKVAYTF